MSDFETNRKTVADAGEALRLAQEEISQIVPLEGDRSRVVSLLNTVGEKLVEVNENFVKDDARDKSTENDVRPGFERRDPSERPDSSTRTGRKAV